MSYKKALERLKALPEDERLLASGVYKFFENGIAKCGCAVGKILPVFYKNLGEFDNIIGRGIHDLIDEIDRYVYSEEILNEFHELVMEDQELEDLQRINDYFGKFKNPVSGKLHTYADYNSPSSEEIKNPNTLEIRQARYNYIVEWLEKKVEEEANVPVTPTS